MIITINNKDCEMKDSCNLLDVLQQAQIVTNVGIAIAVNNTVVPKREWDRFIVKDKDAVLIVNAIVGG
jgi:sulfur carrier protein